MNEEKPRVKDLNKYVGDMSQLFSVKSYRLTGGKADGVRAVDIKNGTGLEFTIIPDRGMDISNFSYKNTNISYISKTGIVAPQYFDKSGLGFLRSFTAGFLTTCGLTYAGAPCNDRGEELGLHGRISNVPGEEVYAGTEWIEGVPVMKVKGKMREAAVFSENIVLDREISCKYGENKIYINDCIENCGFKDEPLMLIYHFNIGYPLLSEDAYFIAPSIKVIPSNDIAAAGINDYFKFQHPTPGYIEQVFFHDLKADKSGRTFAAIVNPKLEIAVVLWFNKNQLGKFIQWKQMGEGEYVAGIEPANCFNYGRAKARGEGTLEFIKPGETKRFNIVVEIKEGVDSIKKLESTL